MLVYTLDSDRSTLWIDANGAVPVIRYWGERLTAEPEPRLWQPALPQSGLDEIRTLSIAPTLADGTFLEPALRAHQSGLGWAPQWRIADTRSKGPHLGFQLLTTDHRLELEWHLTLDTECDVLAISTRLTNRGDESISIEQWLTTLPLPRDVSEVLAFSGRWIQEFQPRRERLPVGALEYTNLRGRTSHDHFPGLLAGTPGFDPQRGEVYGFHLGWSGNHRQRLERNQSGLTQYQAGAHFLPGEIRLAPGETLTAPELYATRSSAGYNTIGGNFQQFVRRRILDWPEAKPRPVHINTWEAVYFDHTQQGLDELAEAGARVGAERYVLDDGWFLGRRDDTAGLGDWVVDGTVYPEKLHPLAATLKRTGLEFGLWVEPEMVNPDSELFRAHPDWVLAIDGQHQPLARQQRVLDLTRTEVRRYLFEQIDALLREYPITYLKWDMNRDLVQAADRFGQAATFRQTEGLYALLEQLRRTHPRVEIESCASGGARMDFGILKHTHRFWLSDCNDAHERQKMQQWAALFFPTEVIGSHIGPPRSHTTRRVHDTYVRAGTAFFAHMGIEWDVRGLNEAESRDLARAIEHHKTWRPVLHQGIRTALTPGDAHQIAFAVSHQDTVLVSVFQAGMPELSVAGPLKLQGLDPGKRYRIRRLFEAEATGHLMKQQPAWMNDTDPVIAGEALVKAGLPLPVMDPETLLVLVLEAVKS